MKNKITVIIPVHNSEKYISKCIKSILDQTYKNIEIVIVTDHCTDESEAICLKVTYNDNRVKIVNAAERGVVNARSTGIQNSTGEYVMFVDSDDWLDKDALEFCINNIENEDLLCFGFKKEYDGIKDDTNYHGGIAGGVYSGKEQMSYIWQNMMYLEGTDIQGILSTVWGKLFKRKIILQFYNRINNNIRCGEDAVFVYWYLLFCKSIKIMNDSYYHYYIRNDSAVHSVDKKFLYNINDIYLQLENVFLNHEFRDSLISQLENRVRLMLNEALSYKMGFGRKSNFRYIIPFKEKLIGKKIILYGAGRVGQDYYQQLKAIDSCTIVAWLDKRYQSLGIDEVTNDSSMLKKLNSLEYNYIVIAIKEPKLAEHISKEINSLGVVSNKIIWKEPNTKAGMSE